MVRDEVFSRESDFLADDQLSYDFAADAGVRLQQPDPMGRARGTWIGTDPVFRHSG